MTQYTTILVYLPDNWKKIFGVLMAFVSFLATVENGVVLITIFKYQALHTTSNKILSSLAMSDFLIGVTVALILSLQMLNPMYIAHATLDMLRRYLSTFLIGASLFNLGFISYDRSLHLRLLNNYNLSKKKLYVLLFLCWSIPFFIPLLRKVDDSETAYSTIIVFVVGIIFVGMICCYGLIIFALRKHQETANINCNNERRSVKTVLMILTLYVISIIPICIYHALNFSKALSREELAKAYIMVMFLCVMNSTINPFIYYLRTPDLKKHVHDLMKSLWKTNKI